MAVDRLQDSVLFDKKSTQQTSNKALEDSIPAECFSYLPNPEKLLSRHDLFRLQ